jgi:hypothetical protein
MQTIPITVGTVPVNLAYRFVAFSLMLQVANFVASQSGMTLPAPVTLAGVRPTSHILLLRERGTNGVLTTNFTGSISTARFFVGYHYGQSADFGQRGYQAESEEEAHALRDKLLALPSLLGTNEAVQVALERFKALGIDTRSLQERCAATVHQPRTEPDASHPEGRPVPLFALEWRVPEGHRSPDGRGSILVMATVLGSSGELVDYDILDTTLFLRPPLRILNAEKLLSMPNATFEALTEAQRSNLVFEASPPLAGGSSPSDLGKAGKAQATATNAWRRP